MTGFDAKYIREHAQEYFPNKRIQNVFFVAEAYGARQIWAAQSNKKLLAILIVSAEGGIEVIV